MNHNQTNQPNQVNQQKHKPPTNSNTRKFNKSKQQGTIKQNQPTNNHNITNASK